MYIARILYPIEVLGYGKRIGIWFVGCPHECQDCSNPELWSLNKKYNISLNSVLNLIENICNNNNVDGFTITGGEPFYQSNQLYLLINKILKITDDILIYTGFTLEQLQMKNDVIINNILKNITVLIDGLYLESLNDGSILRGSSNQKIYILNNKYKCRYDNYLNNTINNIQNFNSGEGIISVGIHKPNFMQDFNANILETGLKEKND